MKSKYNSKELIHEAISMFRKAGIEHPRYNAELIMAHCMNKNRIDLYVDYTKNMTRIEANYFRNLLQRRLKNEPVQYIVGHTEFMSLPFYVNKFVLIPRPETEILVEKVLNYVLENKRRNFNVLDLGTGSGNIIISLAKYAPGSMYYASDISRNAIRIAKKNARLNKIRKNICFINADGFTGFKKMKFNIIVSNPPYIPSEEIKKLQKEVRDYEPLNALDGGETGLDNIFYIINNAYKYLRKNGLLAMEFGYNQSRKIKNYVLKTGKYKDITIIKDYSKKDRILMVKKK